MAKSPRTQKAVIEFLWIGGQQLDLTLNTLSDFEFEAFPGFPETELISWENNLLWSFSKYEHTNKPLVIWDVVAALLAFRQSIPNYADYVLFKWMRNLFGSEFDVSPAISSKISELFSNITSTQLHILNVIIRRVFLKQLKAAQVNCKQQDFEGLDGAVEQQNFWLKLIYDSEKELRERLVCFSFLAILKTGCNLTSEFSKARCWAVVGLGQMVQWVASNPDGLNYHVKLLAEEIGKIEKRYSIYCFYQLCTCKYVTIHIFKSYRD